MTLVLNASAKAFAQPIHHKIDIKLQPDSRFLKAVDQLTIPAPDDNADSIEFRLDSRLKINAIRLSSGLSHSISNVDGTKKSGEPQIQTVRIAKGSEMTWPNPLPIVFHYEGPCNADPQNQSREIFLSGADFFYPQLNSEEPDLITFEMTTTLPAGWSSVSQGKKSSQSLADSEIQTIWKNLKANNEIFIIANRYYEYEERWNDVSLQAYLLKEDERLARRYLNRTKDFLELFSTLLGDYPYSKFALVETAGPAGYGMPSFTYLGSRVIRLPFILETSYPHEILHNWWGNGVFYDPRSTNWAEGLTSYLADHYLKELKGKGAQYRFQELMKYNSYVNSENDFPINEFRYAQGPADQAIGYGKMLMALHMLRKRLGDDQFLEGLRRFYKNNRFQYADLEDLQKSFESVSESDLNGFFSQWTQVAGAPKIELGSAGFKLAEEGYILNLEIRQNNSRPYRLQLPVAVWEEGKKYATLIQLEITGLEETFKIPVTSKPSAVLLDPYTDLFRKLNEGEIPASIGQAFGSQEQSVWVELEKEKLRSAYEKLAQGLSRDSKILNGISGNIPAGSLWALGRNHPLKENFKSQLNKRGISFNSEGMAFEGVQYTWEKHSFVFALPRMDRKDGTATWIIAGTKNSAPGLLRKLPHYGKYGFLVFKGDAPQNILKEQWPAKPAGREKIFSKGERLLPKRPTLKASADK